MGKAEAMASAQTRRGRIVSDLVGSKKPLSGAALAKELGVSRQIIVQDIALLRANGHDIVATNRGYVLAPPREPQVFTRRFKVHHGEDQTIDELETIIDLGGTVKDVMVNHRVYGKVTASLGLKSRRDIARFAEDMRTGRLLMTVTSGYHFHLVSAESEEALDDIEKALADKGYLAEYLPHECE